MTMTSAAQRVPIIDGLGAIAHRYDAILCDVWGVLHNGRRAFAPASDALVAFRRNGGAVVLVSNAPRPSPPVRGQLAALGVSPEAFDAVVTSGDVAIDMIAARGAAPVLHVGPSRDLSLFEAAAAKSGAAPLLVGLDEADYVLCTGLYDDTTETPDDYAERLAAMAARRLTFICANPDLVVRRGSELIHCAGGLAKAYEALGGETIYAGKPYAPIYEAALKAAGLVRGRPLERSRVLAIGDAIHTDVAGAGRQGIDALFVTAGIHRDSLHDQDEATIDEALERLLDGEEIRPIAATRELAP